MNVVKQVVTKTNHYCGDCGHGVWYFDHANLDVAYRLPICCRCPFTPEPLPDKERNGVFELDTEKARRIDSYTR